MIFTLEALQADHGDSLVLHYGPPSQPRFVVIDGGPEGIYRESLRPRLEELHRRWKRPNNGKLELEMMMVSHIDEDHILGVIDWVKEMEQDRAVACELKTFWYNSFDDVLGNTAEEFRGRAASLGNTPPPNGPDARSFRQAMAVVASVRQGRELRTRVDALNIDLNGGFGGLVMLEEDNLAPVKRPGGLSIHVIGPLKKRVEALRREWDKHVRTNPDPVVLAAFIDDSIPNLSSIVVVAEFRQRRMLLTGDARGDDILKGLDGAGFLDGAGRAHFDLIKMPHHGSNRNMTLDWLKKITADHYVISANGAHGNPDKDVIEWLSEARDGQAYSLYLTNDVMVNPEDSKDIGKEIKEALAAHPNASRNVVVRQPGERSVKAEILSPITY